ncbi:MAG: hypothetical protein KC561_13070, partial [Myxococcales bacterium]|nr:hypothetical protein [Myxococcales bacterium]
MGTGLGVCETSNDCMAGEQCLANSCVSENAICVPNTVVCQGNRQLSCNADGSDITETTCSADQICQLGVGCTEQSCEPNEIGCIDGTTAFVCNASGTAEETVACGDGQECSEGVCQNPSCEPGEVACIDGQRWFCGQGDEGWTSYPCSIEQQCSGNLGCSCNNDACVERVCRPGASRCAADGFQTCLEDGSGYGPIEDCTGSFDCVEGACLPPDCLPGEQLCAGDAVLTCNQDGTGYLVEDC